MIDQRLVSSALQYVDTANFERFGQAFYGALQDREFVPLGGVHDGGAEGFDSPENDSELFVDEASSNFLQVSKQESTRQKIRATIKRLRAYGRTPKVLTYITSREVADTDVEQADLSKELSCQIRIRDAKFIEGNINASPVIEGAFVSYLQPSITHLFAPGAANTGERTSEYTDRTLAVFLRQEVDSRRSNSGLLESVVDSLILWALGDTDPDKGIFLQRDHILNKIEQTLPAAKQFVRGVIDHRLELLRAKDAPGGRQLRWYKSSGNYCLPFETRLVIAAENAEDDTIKMRVSCVIEDRLSQISNDDIEGLRPFIVSACHSALERVFERQGLQVAQFACNGATDDELYTDVADILAAVVDRLQISDEDKGVVRRAALASLRATFYQSTEVERLYLQKLSKTYILLLLLKNEPKIVEYFRTVASSFNLYLGTDLIIRALSEHHLAHENRMTVNLLHILKDAGANLILTEKTVEEVATHLRRQMIEFEFNYASLEGKITYPLVEYIDRLLIRSYFYARLSPVEGASVPENWRAYMSQFANYGDIRHNRGDHELASYLIGKFGLIYEDTETMLKGIADDELEELTAAIHAAKGNRGDDDVLAYNDALHVLRVYSRRRDDNEQSPANPFGFRTWWLTQDGKVRRASGRTVARHGGKFFMMRPEFLLNYIGVAPELEEVRKSYSKIFPTALGVRLSARLSEDTFDEVIRNAAEIAPYDDARAGAMIAALLDKLKGDALKMYVTKW